MIFPHFFVIPLGLPTFKNVQFIFWSNFKCMLHLYLHTIPTRRLITISLPPKILYSPFFRSNFVQPCSSTFLKFLGNFMQHSVPFVKCFARTQRRQSTSKTSVCVHWTRTQSAIFYLHFGTQFDSSSLTFTLISQCFQTSLTKLHPPTLK